MPGRPSPSPEALAPDFCLATARSQPAPTAGANKHSAVDARPPAPRNPRYNTHSMSNTAEKRYTVAEYLALERASEGKHEFFEGQIYAIAGANLAHVRICFNLTVALGSKLREGPCEGLGSDMRVK